MTMQPLERTSTAVGNDRYLAAYASVHSLLEDPDTLVTTSSTQAIAVSPPAPGLPAARLGRSTGGRHKVKRRLFRPAPVMAPKVALAAG